MSKISNVNAKPISASVTEVTLNDVGLADVKKRSVTTGFATWVRVLMQNWRQGTVGCKDRSEVNRTNKKPWKQKGTGRARAGTARSPLWRGGGVVFGPQPRVRSLTVSKNLKKAVLSNILIEKIEQSNFLCADWNYAGHVPSTKYASNMLKTAQIDKEKEIVLFLPWTDTITRSSFRNIPNVRIVFFDQPNAFDIAIGTKLLVLKQNEQQLKEMVEKWS